MSSAGAVKSSAGCEKKRSVIFSSSSVEQEKKKEGREEAKERRVRVCMTSKLKRWWKGKGHPQKKGLGHTTTGGRIVSISREEIGKGEKKGVGKSREG